MYGMIHRAVRQMVLDTKGEEEWLNLARLAGVGPVEMISIEVYDDEVTFNLIAKAAEFLETPLETLLVDFGRFWIGFAERGSFGHIMDFTGRDLIRFIGNLDRMHSSVTVAMPDARMPSFTLVQGDPHRIVVEYRSSRTGLELFVQGLFLGLLDRFEVTGSVSIMPPDGNPPRFEIQIQ